MSAGTASVRAKSILFGEWSVVFSGGSALAVPSSATCEAVVTVGHLQHRLRDPKFSVDALLDTEELRSYLATARAAYQDFRSGNAAALSPYRTPEGYLKVATALALESAGVAHAGNAIELTFSTGVPAGGFGRSASGAAAIVRAVATAFNVDISDEDVFTATMEAEGFQHGYPSGIDSAVAAYQNTIELRHHEDGEREVIRYHQDPSFSAALRNCYALHTGAPAMTTGETMSFVRGRVEKSPVVTDNLFAIMNDCVTSFLDAWSSSILSAAFVHDLIGVNGEALDALGVLSDEGKKVTAEIQARGGAAKVSGAGSSAPGPIGAMVVSIEDAEWLADFAEANEFKLFKPT